ncbi:hypothetical protein AAC387_Pa11g1491 [Persea americana]
MYTSQPQAHEKYGQEARSFPVPVPPNDPLQPSYHPPYAPSNMFIQSRNASGRWSTGLCHCCDDPANCLITCFCPCITFGQIAEIVNRGSLSCPASGGLYLLLGFTGFACLYSCFYRSRLRADYDLEETPCVDCLVHFCCECCALSQEYRELKNRGYDMGIGEDRSLF